MHLFHVWLCSAELLMVVNAPPFVPLVLFNTCFKSPFFHRFYFPFIRLFVFFLLCSLICILFGILRLDLNLLPHSSPSGKFWLILFTFAAAAVQATAPVDALSWFLPFLLNLEHSKFFALFWPHSSHFEMFHPHICTSCGHCLRLAAPQLSHLSAHQPSHCNKFTLTTEHMRWKRKWRNESDSADQGGGWMVSFRNRSLVDKQAGKQADRLRSCSLCNHVSSSLHPVSMPSSLILYSTVLLPFICSLNVHSCTPNIQC